MKIVLQKKVAVTFLVIVFLSLIIQFDLNGDWDGLYLLKGKKWYQIKVKDDLLLGEYEYLILKFEFDSIRSSLFSKGFGNLSGVSAYMTYKWNTKNGSGYFESVFPNGTKFVTCLGRFVDDEKKHVHGLFVGGGLPSHLYDSGGIDFNETGVAYFDGKKWQHIWCIANEVLFSASNPLKAIPPSSWAYLGSKVIHGAQDELVIKSSHLAQLQESSVKIDRYLIYNSENYFFHLIVRLTNVGQSTTLYNYVYGDEPWVGDFGSSKGNVGWTKDQIYNYETAINPAQHDFVGMYDIGNTAIGETRDNYTGLANFIEWQGSERPDYAYFANETGKRIDNEAKIPLDHKTNRLMMVQWALRKLNPGDSRTMHLVIGMANKPVVGIIPSKPNTNLSPDDLAYVLSQ